MIVIGLGYGWCMVQGSGWREYGIGTPAVVASGLVAGVELEVSPVGVSSLLDSSSLLSFQVLDGP